MVCVCIYILVSTCILQSSNKKIYINILRIKKDECAKIQSWSEGIVVHDKG